MLKKEKKHSEPESDSQEAAIKQTIRDIPGLRPEIDEKKIHAFCNGIFLASWAGGNNEQPYALNESVGGTVSELEKFEKLAMKLALHIQEMHAPARKALEDISFLMEKYTVQNLCG